MHLVHDCFMSTIGSLHFTAAVSSLNLTLIPTTAYYFHMETQNDTCCKRNYTLLYFYISEELITCRKSLIHWKSRSLLQRTRQKKNVPRHIQRTGGCKNRIPRIFFYNYLYKVYEKYPITRQSRLAKNKLHCIAELSPCTHCDCCVATILF